MWEKQRTSTLLPPPQSAEAEFDPLCQLAPRPEVLAGAASPPPFRCGHDLPRRSFADPAPPGRNRTQARLDAGRVAGPDGHRLFGTPGQSSKEGLRPLASARADKALQAGFQVLPSPDV